MSNSPHGVVPPHGQDPVPENPFPVDDQRHEAWKKATRDAKLDLHRLKQSTLEKPRSQDPDQNQRLYVEFILRRFQIWAKRGLSVVWTYECATDYEQWLDTYMQAELKLWEENCPAGLHKEFFLPELKRQLLRACAYWSGNALENVAALEAQGLTAAPEPGPTVTEDTTLPNAHEFPAADDLAATTSARDQADGPVGGNSARGNALNAMPDSDSNWRNLSPDDPRYKTRQLILGVLQRDESRARADFAAACEANGLQLPAIVTLVEQKFDGFGRAIAMTVKNTATAEVAAQGLNEALELTLTLYMPWFQEIERRCGISSSDLARESRIRLMVRMEHWKAQAFQYGLEEEIRALTDDPKLEDAAGEKATGTTPSTPEAGYGAAAPINEQTGAERLYRRSGDSWELRFAGKAFHVSDRKGMKYIAELLRSPGRSFACLELRAALSENSSRRAQVDEESGVDMHPAGFDRNEILDDTARKDYKRRLDSNKEELREAELNNDPGRHERLSDERKAIIKQLKAATGLSGRSRTFSNDEEKARKAVSGAINDALKAIAKHHAQLARHLDDRIDRGTSCCYKGDGIEWEM